MLEVLQDNNNVGNNDRCGSVLANKGDLAYMREPLIICYSELHIRCCQGTRICLRYLLY